MDFIDWRKASPKIHIPAEAEQTTVRRRSKSYRDYVEEQIREAEERGEFANLPGMGKPLQLDENVYAGDKALAYSMLKSNGYAPAEIELAKEVRIERERAEAKLAPLVHRGKTLRRRRVPPFPSEKRAFNTAVTETAAEYEQTLRNINRKILTLNLTTPLVMHQPLLEVEALVQAFLDSCPLFVV